MLAGAAEPAPAAITKLHVGEIRDAGLHNDVHLGFIEDWIAVIAFPLSRSDGCIPQFLSVQVCSFLLNVGKIDTHPFQSLLSDHRRQKTIERLFCATVRIFDQVR